MDDIHSKDFQIKYKKSKVKVRQWENKFVAENGRLPTKEDIKASPASVKGYYKLYWKLKTKILEAEILGEDSPKNGVASANLDNVLKDQVNTVKKDKKDAEESFKIQNSEKDLPNTSKENLCIEVADSKTWGAHLNKSQPVCEEKEKHNLLNNVIAGRLFQGTSFKKRNPRKALSFNKKKSNKSLQSEEGINSFESFDSSVLSPCFDSVIDSSQDTIIPDQSFGDSLFNIGNDCSPNIKALITSSSSLSPLLNTKEQENITKKQTNNLILSVNSVQVMASDPSFPLKQVRNLDAGWVERCNEAESKDARKSNSDSGFESLENSLPDLKEDDKNIESSEDDLIAGSDNEIDENFKLSSSFVAQKRKSDFSFIESTEDNLPKVFEKSPEEQVRKKIKLDVSQPCQEEALKNTKAKTKENVQKTILERKIQTGTMNDNFVKINLKKKVFVRGKKHFNLSKHKKREWKYKKKNLNDGGESGGVIQCYKCGETGHFSRYCQKPEDKLLDVEGNCEDEEDLPTLEDAEKMAQKKAEDKQFIRKSVLVPKEENLGNPSALKVESFYSINCDNSQCTEEVYEALAKFGHSSFRPGQEEAIMRILRGQSTLLTIATGGGKSLCYQLPAYLYAKRSKCITLVVSPLVSLMEDQVAGSSSFFKVGCFHTSQTQKQREAVMEDVQNGKLYALLVSPEAVVSGDSFTYFGNIIKKLPPIAFACIDEVHCVSQWSHNFRPSYLMISKVLREKLGITTILGLTATATFSTIKSITQEIGVDEEGVIKDIPLPDNLYLTISRDENKDKALLNLLASERFRDANAILIYCTRRDECERIAVLVRTALQNSFKERQRTSKRISWNAESYHAGMAAARRRQVQKAFMCGNLRIVVATVAFGMGINKQDIRGVIHYNMPKDFESYVQEVGRAGRDGLPAHCHLFLDSKGQDLNELRRHIHSNTVDRHVLRKLLQRVFMECSCKEKDDVKICEGHEIAFGCQETIQALDIPEENIYTLLCYLELHPKKFVKVLSPVNINCQIKSYKGMKAIVAAAKDCPPLAYAYALNSQKKKEKSEVLEFNVIEVANKLRWDSSLVKSQLKATEWEMTSNTKWRKTGITVSFSDLGFRVCSRGDLTSCELDEALDYLIQRVESQEKKSMAQLDITFSTFAYFATENCSSPNDIDESKCEGLKKAIRKYFETEEHSSEIPMQNLEVEDFEEETVAGDVRVLLHTHRDNNFNGRAVARIFHGIQSPNYPASLWFRTRFWRKHLDKDFKKICRIATREILRIK